MSTTVMTPAQWASIPDNPRQRDTARHLRTAKHLLSPSPTHAHVAMAMNPTPAQRWKLDGHTRSLRWHRHPDLAPKELVVTVYEVRSVEEAIDLYTHFDNAGAAENVVDRLTGALHAVEWRPKSPFLRSYRFTNALRLAQTIVSGEDADKLTVYDLVPKWLLELQAFDDLSPPVVGFKSGVVAAALITLRRHSTKASEFWSLYAAGKGVKLENEIDGVEALQRFVDNTRTIGRDAQKDLLARAVSCFEQWRHKKTYSLINRSRVTPKVTDMTRYVSEMYR